MSKYEIITIKVNKNQLNKLKELGISPQEVFSKGLEEALRKKLKEYIPIVNNFDDLIEDDDEYDAFELPDSRFDKFIISDDEIDNN